MPNLDDPAALEPIAGPAVPKPRERKAANSLASYKSRTSSGEGEAVLVAKTKTKKPSRPRKAKTGPKAKPKSELYGEQIALMLTPAQRAKVEKKAGLAPMGKYIRHILETQTDVFK